jgi:hypothetical protein
MLFLVCFSVGHTSNHVLILIKVNLHLLCNSKFCSYSAVVHAFLSCSITQSHARVCRHYCKCVCGTEFMWSVSFIKFGCSVFVAVSGRVHRTEHKIRVVSLEIKLQTESNNNQRKWLVWHGHDQRLQESYVTGRPDVPSGTSYCREV